MQYRADRYGDSLIIGENKESSNVYLKRVPLLSKDVVLDIGAHIGAFSTLIAGLCERVIAVEPEPENFVLLLNNVPSYVKVISGAVVGERVKTQTVKLYTSAGNTGTHRIAPTRGRNSMEVVAIPFVPLVNEYAVSYVKIDCEGAEYSILGGDIPCSVRAIVGEVHMTSPYRYEHAVDLMSHLEEWGFTVSFQKNKNKAWTRYFHAVRNT